MDLGKINKITAISGLFSTAVYNTGVLSHGKVCVGEIARFDYDGIFQTIWLVARGSLDDTSHVVLVINNCNAQIVSLKSSMRTLPFSH